MLYEFNESCVCSKVEDVWWEVEGYDKVVDGYKVLKVKVGRFLLLLLWVLLFLVGS